MEKKFKVSFYNFGRQYKFLQKEYNLEVRHALSKGDIARGSIGKFEEEFAQFLGVKHCITVHSRTDAMFFSLKALGIGQGNEVITTSMNFIGTLAAIKHCGATTILVDVGVNMLIKLRDISRGFNKKTKAIIVPHLNGNFIPFIKTGDLSLVPIIEDSSHAVGVEGAGSWGFISVFSLDYSKILGCFGDGAAICTNNDKIAHEIDLMRNHYQIKGIIPEYMSYGWSSTLDNIHAILLRIKLKRIHQYIAQRKRIAKVYDKQLIGIVKTPLERKVYQNYEIETEKRDDLTKYLLSQGVETQIKYNPPYHLIDGLGLSHFDLPITEALSKTLLFLPCNSELTFHQAYYVAKKIKEFYKKYGKN